MVDVQYDHNHLRARKARAAHRITKSLSATELGISGALVAATLYLLLQHHAAGWSLLGLSLIAAMLLIWQRWDLMNLEPNGALLQQPMVPLAEVMESTLLAGMAPNISVEGIWRVALKRWEAIFMVNRLGLPHDVITDMLKQKNPNPQVFWSDVVEVARQYGSQEVDGSIVVVTTLLRIPELKDLLEHIKVQESDVISVLAWQQRLKQTMRDQKAVPTYGGIGRDWASGYTPLLNQFAVNISREIELGYYRTLPSVHEPVAHELMEYLNEGRPVVLVGNVGSGKTALVYEVASRIIKGEVKGRISYDQVMSVNAGLLIASGAGLEEAIISIINEAVHAKNTILFFDEAQLFFSSGSGAVDISQILLPILQRNLLPMVFAMTEHDWQSLTAHNPALVSQFQRLAVAEPAVEATASIMQDAALGVEHKANVVITHGAIKEAIRLAERYLTEQAFPGKGITVLESASHYAQDGVVTATSVQQSIEYSTGAKVTAASAPERTQLLDLENQIHERMINQKRAVTVVADALRRARAGVNNPRRPIGSFLFLGPTGVGKTELAKALAAIYYGSESAMVRLDMSEYQQQGDVARLLSPGSTSEAGYTLASGVRQQPSSVILLDEVEKAHPDILNLLLQVLDEGRLTDRDGRVVSFKDAILIATSNAGADDIRNRITNGQLPEQFESEITRKLISDHIFRPELLNRFDEIVVFRPLSKSELAQVVALMMAEVNATLATQNITVRLADDATTWLVEHGYDPQLGARPLRRMVQRSVENIAAQRILAGSITAGQTLTLSAADLDATHNSATA